MPNVLCELLGGGKGAGMVLPPVTSVTINESYSVLHSLYLWELKSPDIISSIIFDWTHCVINIMCSIIARLLTVSFVQHSIAKNPRVLA